jgi:hypothetical protein
LNASLSDYLEANVDALATEVTRRMEDERPELFARYRDRPGRTGKDAAEWCREDTAFHLRHLAAALDSGDPEEFVAYRSWLVGLLGARGIPEDDIDANFKAIGDVITARLGDEGRPAVSVLGSR